MALAGGEPQGWRLQSREPQEWGLRSRVMLMSRAWLISVTELDSRTGLVSMAELVSRVQGGTAKAASIAASSRGRLDTNLLDTGVLAWCSRNQQSSGAFQHVLRRHLQFSQE